MSLYPPIYGTRIGPYANAITVVNSATIVIANADVAQSGTDATTYCNLRGIPTANIRSVHFGTIENLVNPAGLISASALGYVNGSGVPIGSQYISTAAAYNGVAAGSSLFTMIANEIVNYGALCILLSTYTPTRKYSSQPVPAACGNAYALLNSLSNFGNGLQLALTSAAYANNVVPYDWASTSKNPTYARPHGRIGSPDLSQQGVTFAELPLNPAVGSNWISTCVSQAIAAEQLDQKNGSVYYSPASDVYSTYGAAATTFSSWASAIGLTNTTNMGTQSDVTSIASQFQCGTNRPALSNVFGLVSLQTANNAWDTTTLQWAAGGAPTNGATSGTLSAPFPTTLGPTSGSIQLTLRTSTNQICTGLFTVGSATVTTINPSIIGTPGVALSVLVNNASYGYNNPNVWGYDGNYTFSPGAWGGCWYSYQWNLMMDAIYNGACAWISDIAEPGAPGIPFTTEVAHMLINQKLPIALAAFYAPGTGGQAFNSTVFGDPLYQPYKSTVFPNAWANRGLIGQPQLVIGMS